MQPVIGKVSKDNLVYLMKITEEKKKGFDIEDVCDLLFKDNWKVKSSLTDCVAKEANSSWFTGRSNCTKKISKQLTNRFGDSASNKVAEFILNYLVTKKRVNDLDYKNEKPFPLSGWKKDKMKSLSLEEVIDRAAKGDGTTLPKYSKGEMIEKLEVTNKKTLEIFESLQGILLNSKVRTISEFSNAADNLLKRAQLYGYGTKQNNLKRKIYLQNIISDIQEVFKYNVKLIKSGKNSSVETLKKEYKIMKERFTLFSTLKDDVNRYLAGGSKYSQFDYDFTIYLGESIPKIKE